MTDDELKLLTWRFSAMIGIIQPDPRYSTAEEVERDRAQWPELVTTRNGMPVFDFDLCAEWMVECSGESLNRCRKVLFSEWGDEEDQAHAEVLLN